MCRDLRKKTKYTPAFGSGERRGLERTSVRGKSMPAPWGELRRHCVRSPALPRPGPARCVPGLALPGLGACPVPVPQTLALPPPPSPVWPAAAALGRGPARRGGAAVRAGMCSGGPQGPPSGSRALSVPDAAAVSGKLGGIK